MNETQIPPPPPVAAETTPVHQWKKSSHHVLTLPSGNNAIARRPGIKAFIVSGKVPNSLLPMMKGALAGKPVSMKELEVTESLLDDMDRLLNIVVCDCFVQPPVQMPPKDPSERKDEILYADELEDLDKNFVFQWAVGGTSDLEEFRQKSLSVLADLSDGKGVEQDTQ